MPELDPEAPPETTFVRVTNAEIYTKLLDLEDRVGNLNVKFYGLLTGLLGALALLLHQGGII